MVIIILCDIVVCLLFAIVVVGIRIHKKKRILKDSLSHGFKMIEISPFKKNEFKQFSFKLFDTAIMGSNPKESDIIFDKSTGLLPVHAIIKREDNSIFVTKAVEKQIYLLTDYL